MFPHPFIGDLSSKTIEELQKTISDLNTKMNFAYRRQNNAMVIQLQMILESYKAEYSRKMDELYKKQNIQDKINITKTN